MRTILTCMVYTNKIYRRTKYTTEHKTTWMGKARSL